MLINESEILSFKDIKYIISFNKRHVEKRGDLFELEDKDRDFLDKIPNKLNAYNNIDDRHERIIKKATYLLAGISWKQPFGDGNKETAHFITIRFLKRNGFRLLNTSSERRELFKLLIKTIEKPPIDSTIFKEVEEYITKKIT
jgi:prophage maintenance system killer protein